MHEDAKPDDPHNEKFVKVSISTTAGFFPAEGFDQVPANQKVDVELKHAQNKLKIKDTTGWVATVTNASGRRTIDPERSYSDNQLAGTVEIDWGPSEGGGG
jgi:hypothetical protein